MGSRTCGTNKLKHTKNINRNKSLYVVRSKNDLHSQLYIVYFLSMLNQDFTSFCCHLYNSRENITVFDFFFQLETLTTNRVLFLLLSSCLSLTLRICLQNLVSCWQFNRRPSLIIFKRIHHLHFHIMKSFIVYLLLVIFLKLVHLFFHILLPPYDNLKYKYHVIILFFVFYFVFYLLILYMYCILCCTGTKYLQG